jgi:hypothetical protein
MATIVLGRRVVRGDGREKVTEQARHAAAGP